MPRITVRNLKAADPGVGFNLDISDVPVGTSTGQLNPNAGLAVWLKVTDPEGADTHTCKMFIPPPIQSSEDLVIVIPFFCKEYNSISQFPSIKVTVKQNDINLPGSPYTQENVDAESGQFTYTVN